MAKRAAAATYKRTGTAFWLADADGDMLRAIAKAEDRSLQKVISRALRAYAERSQEYQNPPAQARRGK